MGVDGGAVADLVARAYRPPPPSDEEIAAHEARLAAARRREQRRRLGITVAVLVVAIVAGLVAVVAVRRADAGVPPPLATSVPDPASANSTGLLAIPGVVRAGEALGVLHVDVDGSSVAMSSVDLQRRGPEGWVPVTSLEVRSGIVAAEGPAYPSPCDPGCTGDNAYDVAVGEHVVVPRGTEPGDYRVCAAVREATACGEFAVR